jgi:hypothetical protein
MIPSICPKCGGVDRRYLARNRRRLGVAVTWACCCSDTPAAIPCGFCPDDAPASFDCSFSGINLCGCINVFGGSILPTFSPPGTITVYAESACFWQMPRPLSSVAGWNDYGLSNCAGSATPVADDEDCAIQVIGGPSMTVEYLIGGRAAFSGTASFTQCATGPIVINNDIGAGDCNAVRIGWGGTCTVTPNP